MSCLEDFFDFYDFYDLNDFYDFNNLPFTIYSWLLYVLTNILLYPGKNDRVTTFTSPDIS
jgi:hypothetical protein